MRTSIKDWTQDLMEAHQVWTTKPIQDFIIKEETI
jgi:hypothetical protein